MVTEKERRHYRMKELICFFIVLALILLGVSLLSGCATVVERDAQGNVVRQIESSGFLRNANYSSTSPDGTVTTLSTQSTTSDILLGLDKLTGTLIDGAGKAAGAVK